MANPVNLSLQPVRSPGSSGFVVGETTPAGQEGAFALLLSGGKPAAAAAVAVAPGTRKQGGEAVEAGPAADPLGREVALVLGAQPPSPAASQAALALPVEGGQSRSAGLSPLGYTALSRPAVAMPREGLPTGTMTGAAAVGTGGQGTAGIPTVEAAVAGNPLTGGMAQGDSLTQAPVAGNPVAGNPVASNPVAGNPVADIPMTGTAVAGSGAAGTGMDGNSSAEVPVAGNPVAGGTGVELADAAPVREQAGPADGLPAEAPAVSAQGQPAVAAPGAAPAASPAAPAADPALAAPAGIPEVAFQLQGRQAAVARQLGIAGPDAKAGPTRPVNPEAVVKPQAGAASPELTTAVGSQGDKLFPGPDQPVPTDAGEALTKFVTDTNQPIRTGAAEALTRTDPSVEGLAPRLESPLGTTQPGSTTSTTPASPLQQPLTPGRPEFSQTLGQQLVWMVNQDRQRAEISVNPRHLGPVEVSLSMEQGKAHVQFFAHDAGVRDALEQAMPRLRELFNGNGLELGQASVTDQSHRQQQGEQAARQGRSFAGQQGGEGFEGEEGDAPATAWSVGGDRMVDHYV